MCLKIALLAVLLSTIELPTEAHDIYSHLVDATGVSCCDERDCRPAPYRVTASGVQMYVHGEWVEVPDHKIQYRTLPGDSGETGGGHWCGGVHEVSEGMLHIIHCAVLPPNSASVSYTHPE